MRQPPVVLETGMSASGGDYELGSQVASLPERQRLVIFLRYFADLDYREIADALGVSVGTVSARLHAAHATLRAVLQEVSA